MKRILMVMLAVLLLAGCTTAPANDAAVTDAPAALAETDAGEAAAPSDTPAETAPEDEEKAEEPADTGESAAPASDAATDGIDSFYYEYSTADGAAWTFLIWRQDAQVFVSAEQTNAADPAVLQGTLDNAVLSELAALIDEQGIAGWNGFNQEQTGGERFQIRVTYADGTELFAQGNGAYPEGYEAGHAALSSYLEGLTK